MDSSFIKYIFAYITTGTVFFALDFIWLGVIAKNFYNQQMGDLKADNIRFSVAAGFYAVYIIGLIYFAVRPALSATNPVLTAGLLGAAFGFFCYATYDFTNLAVLKGYPTKVAIVDLIWGSFLSGISAGLGLWLLRIWGKAS